MEGLMAKTEHDLKDLEDLENREEKCVLIVISISV